MDLGDVGDFVKHPASMSTLNLAPSQSLILLAPASLATSPKSPKSTRPTLWVIEPRTARERHRSFFCAINFSTGSDRFHSFGTRIPLLR